MRKTSRVIFLIIGCIMPIFIGAVHTIVYFYQLITPEIQEYLQKEFIYSGKSQPLWDAWGVANFMMRISFVTIGLLNISALRKLSKIDYPPIFSIIAMIFYLIGVIYVGVKFEQTIQFYGGIVGIVLIFGFLILSTRQNQKEYEY